MCSTINKPWILILLVASILPTQHHNICDSLVIPETITRPRLPGRYRHSFVVEQIDTNHVPNFVMMFMPAAASQNGGVRIRRSNSCLFSSTTSENQEVVDSTTKSDQTSSSSSNNNNNVRDFRDNQSQPQTKKRRKKRRKYHRKRGKTATELERDRIRTERQQKYEAVRKNSEVPSLWSFETLFPEPVLDEETVKRDLYEISQRDKKKFASQLLAEQKQEKGRMGANGVGSRKSNVNGSPKWEIPIASDVDAFLSSGLKKVISEPDLASDESRKKDSKSNVDKALTRLVEDRVYGFRRSNERNSRGERTQYDTSLMNDGAVQFRDGVRLGHPLKVNADRLCYHARRELNRGHIEEAQELYEMAVNIDPRDGRAYLGLSRAAQKRRDFSHARTCLRAGIANSVILNTVGSKSSSGSSSSSSSDANGGTEEELIQADYGANPYLLQALGDLEERMGNLAEAEALYIESARSRPTHAAAWVSLGQLRTRKLRQGANAGRVCFQTAERELREAGLPQSSHVYTAWASLEYKKAGNTRRARELFNLALELDPRCSAAWLQLGAMEAHCQNWDKAEDCFEAVLMFDQRNSRVLQAYSIMESKRPDGDSRRAIGLFDRAMKTNPRDGGVLQAYALYVAKLGDIDTARDLLRKATKIDKRHAAAWQAWGVLETRHGTAKSARDVFQQGIWACAQSSGGQSGGRRCARLWQAWGVLEAREGDHAGARRCFSRALDADSRNVAAITAWALMEEELGNYRDARSLFERGLKQLPSSSNDKTSLWRAYEVMEERAGNVDATKQVYQRSMRDKVNEELQDSGDEISRNTKPPPLEKVLNKNDEEVEVVSWKTNKNVDLGGEVWLNEGSIEGKVPFSTLKKMKKQKSRNQT